MPHLMNSMSYHISSRNASQRAYMYLKPHCSYQRSLGIKHCMKSCRSKWPKMSDILWLLLSQLSIADTSDLFAIMDVEWILAVNAPYLWSDINVTHEMFQIHVSGFHTRNFLAHYDKKLESMRSLAVCDHTFKLVLLLRLS